MDLVADAYILTSFLCSGIIVFDIFVRANRQMMKIMDYVWPITSLYLNAFGLWAYWVMGRPDSMPRSKPPMTMEHTMDMDGEMKMDQTEMMHNRQKPFWQSIFVSATHCGAGCEIGDFLGEWIVFLALSTVATAGSIIYTEYAVDFVLAYILGIMFQYIPIRKMRSELTRVATFKNAIKADSLSLVAFEVGCFGWMAVFQLGLFGNLINQSSPVYWFMMQIGMLLGHFTSYPANWFLVKAGIKEGM